MLQREGKDRGDRKTGVFHRTRKAYRKFSIATIVCRVWIMSRHLRLVEAIAVEGAMTRAAVRLYITQSALSHQLTGLEQALGVSLLRRVPRGMILTRPAKSCSIAPDRCSPTSRAS